jgi:hypothetical protein
MIFIQLCIFNVICAVCNNRRWTRWFRFTTFNKSSNTISIVAMSLTFDFKNADFIIILIGFLLFRCHKKRINWQCLFFRRYFFLVIFMFMSVTMLCIVMFAESLRQAKMLPAKPNLLPERKSLNVKVLFIK